MIHFERMKNCGIVEIVELSGCANPTEALQGLEPELRVGITWPYERGTRKGLGYPFIVFTGVVKRYGGRPIADNYGDKFANFITQHKLGSITTQPGSLNWTGKTIQIWVWTPHYENLWNLFDGWWKLEKEKNDGKQP